MHFHEIPSKYVSVVADVLQLRPGEDAVALSRRIVAALDNIPVECTQQRRWPRIFGVQSKLSLCNVHSPLNASLVQSLLHQIQLDVGYRLNSFVSRSDLLTPVQLTRVNRLRSLHALWLRPDDYEKTFLVSATNSKWQYEQSQCDACILTHVTSDLETLLDLRIAVCSLCTSAFVARNGHPRLQKWIDAWIAAFCARHGAPVQLNLLLRDNDIAAEEFRKIRSIVHRERRRNLISLPIPPDRVQAYQNYPRETSSLPTCADYGGILPSTMRTGPCSPQVMPDQDEAGDAELVYINPLAAMKSTEYLPQHPTVVLPPKNLSTDTVAADPRTKGQNPYQSTGYVPPAGSSFYSVENVTMLPIVVNDIEPSVHHGAHLNIQHTGLSIQPDFNPLADHDPQRVCREIGSPVHRYRRRSRSDSMGSSKSNFPTVGATLLGRVSADVRPTSDQGQDPAAAYHSLIGEISCSSLPAPSRPQSPSAFGTSHSTSAANRRSPRHTSHRPSYKTIRGGTKELGSSRATSSSPSSMTLRSLLTDASLPNTSLTAISATAHFSTHGPAASASKSRSFDCRRQTSPTSIPTSTQTASTTTRFTAHSTSPSPSQTVSSVNTVRQRRQCLQMPVGPLPGDVGTGAPIINQPAPFSTQTRWPAYLPHSPHLPPRLKRSNACKRKSSSLSSHHTEETHDGKPATADEDDPPGTPPRKKVKRKSKVGNMYANWTTQELCELSGTAPSHPQVDPSEFTRQALPPVTFEAILASPKSPNPRTPTISPQRLTPPSSNARKSSRSLTKPGPRLEAIMEKGRGIRRRTNFTRFGRDSVL